jgi:hypothetical protein
MDACPIITILKVGFSFFRTILKTYQKDLSHFLKRGHAVLSAICADKTGEKEVLEDGRLLQRDATEPGYPFNILKFFD